MANCEYTVISVRFSSDRGYHCSEKARLTRTAKSTITASSKGSRPAYITKRSYGSNANGGGNLMLAGKHGHSGKRTFASQLSSANGGTSVAKRVVIDGVTYEFAEDGNLKRVDGEYRFSRPATFWFDNHLSASDAVPARQKKRKLDNRDGSQGYVGDSRTPAGYALSPSDHTVKRCQGVALGLHLDGKLIHARIHPFTAYKPLPAFLHSFNHLIGFALLQWYVLFPLSFRSP